MALVSWHDSEWALTAAAVGLVLGIFGIVRGGWVAWFGVVYGLSVALFCFPLQNPLSGLVSPGALKIAAGMGLFLSMTAASGLGGNMIRFSALGLIAGALAGKVLQPSQTGLLPSDVHEDEGGFIIAREPLYAQSADGGSGHFFLIRPGERGTPWSQSHAHFLGMGAGVFVLSKGACFLPHKKGAESQPIWTYLGGSKGIWPMTAVHTETLMKEGI